MTAKLLPLAALAASLAWGEAEAARGFEQNRSPSAAGDALLLAQAREVDIFIDEFGREVIVDAYTGEVLAIRRQRGRGLGSPSQRRIAREYELERRPLREPLGERLNRELETLLGRREPPAGFDPDFRQRPMPQPEYGLPRESFPEPPLREDDDRITRPRPEPFPQEPGSGGLPSRNVERSPLQPPQPMPDEDVAAIPEDEEIVIEPTRPDVRIAPPMASGATEAVAGIQILLDRMGVSPGVIDGRMGDNVNKALAAYREKTGGALRTYDPSSIEAALAESGGPAFVEYTIQPTDVAGPYVASIPEDYGAKAQLERLGFTSVTEMLAERFHMDETYLKAINPGVNFDRPGTIVRVANVGEPLKTPVSRIIADKSTKQVRAYDEAGRLVAAYPATIGSGDTPSPSGIVTVERIAFDPDYTYNPKVNFKQGDNDRVLTIPPGPNGPVGSIWIALSKPTYGIHGTPEPSKIGKTYSHGCVRLTNWDAAELARMVKAGVTVEFVE